jgi:hypothetical protein
MGNSYTFELESLLFFGITWAVCNLLGLPCDQLSVYGDDIIAPAAARTKLQAVLQELGFTVNTEKSYSDGPFRESCGKDYFKGFDIRPFYLKGNWRASDLCAFHNFLKRTGWEHIFDSTVKDLRSLIPEGLRKEGPDGYGDGHLVSDNWVARPHNRSRGWSGFLFSTWVNKTKRIRKPVAGDAILPFYSIYIGATGDHFTVRGSVGEKAIDVYTLAR